MLCDEDDVTTMLRSRLYQYPGLESSSQRGRFIGHVSRRERSRTGAKGMFSPKALLFFKPLGSLFNGFARGISGLTITELKLASLAVLNGILYFLWCNKLLDVACPGLSTFLQTRGRNTDHGFIVSRHSSYFGRPFLYAKVGSQIW